MVGLLRNSWTLFLGIALLSIGNGLQGTLLGLRGSLEGFSANTLGFVMGGYYIGQLMGAWFTPALLRKVGHIRVFAAYGSIISAVLILYILAIDPIAWFVLRVIVGYTFAGIYIVAESWINDAASNENRGKAMSTYIFMQMSGIVIGQLCLNLGDPAEYGLFVLISVLVSLSFAPVLLTVGPTPVFATARPMTLLGLYRTSPFGTVGILMLGGVLSACFGMGAVYAKQAGFTVVEISIFLTLIYLGAVLSQIPVGWLSDQIDRRVLVILVALTGALASLVGGVLGPLVLFEIEGVRVSVFFLSALVLGAMTNPIYGLLIAHLADHLEKDDLASASSGMLFLHGVGATIGPVVVGYLIAFGGADAWWFYLAMLQGAIVAYGLWRLTQRSGIAPEDTAPYAPMAPQLSAVGMEVMQDSAIEAAEHEEGTAQQGA
ncbi:MAG: MFS transporter [Neomegalonema sp.]|nr:MFS transporter [Neomegalonema sp.]